MECTGCGKPARHSCAKCFTVKYCSKLCQRENWKHHKQSCFPLKFECSEEFGKHMVTTRLVKQWEILLKESAIALGPSLPTHSAHQELAVKPEAVCLACCRELKPTYTTCTTCGWPTCNSICEKSSGHADFECALFAAASVPFSQESFDNISILALRCLLLKTVNPEKYKQIMGLKANLESRADDSRFVKFARFVKEDCKLENIDDTEIYHALGVELTNAFEGNVKARRCIYLYNIGSWLAHNCVPNGYRVINQEGEFQVRASVDIPAGTRVTISYISSWQTTLERQSKFQMDHFFTCYCARCSDPSELGSNYTGLKCTAFNGGYCPGYLIPLNPFDLDTPWQCTGCERNTEQKHVNEFNTQISEALKRVPGSMCTVQEFDAFDKFIEAISKKVHPNHCVVRKLENVLAWKLHTYLAAKLPLSEPGTEETNRKWLLRLVELCEHQLKVWNMLWPGYNDFRGTVLYLLSTAKMNLLLLEGIPHPTPNLLRCRREKVQEVEDMRNIAYTILSVEPSDELQMLARSIREDPIFLAHTVAALGMS